MPKRSILTKRRLIEASGRNMFYWVAGASVIVAFSLVALQFIYQDFRFNNEIINHKNETIRTLKDNLTKTDQLKDEVNKLLANEHLAKSRSYEGQDNHGVVIDALPVQATVTSLPAAIQKVIVPRSGVTLVSLRTPAEVEESNDPALAQEVKPVENVYGVEVIGNYDAIKTFLQLLENTVRPIHITAVSFTGTEGALRVSVTLSTYYQPAKVFELKEEVLRQ